MIRVPADTGLETAQDVLDSLTQGEAECLDIPHGQRQHLLGSSEAFG